MPVVSTLEVAPPSVAGSPPSHGPPDALDRVSEVLLRIKPFSLQALGVFLLTTLLGACVQGLVVLTVGSGIPFAGFFPAIAIAAIVAGAPAGVAVSIASLVLVWWAVREPHFVFHTLSLQDRLEMAWLLGCALILVAFGLLCRVLLERAYRRQQAMNILIRELEHRRANTFAVLRAITTRTLQHDPDSAGRLLRRFESMRKMNDLLTEQPSGALLTAILRNELEGLPTDQVEMHGADVLLSADQARSVVLIVHELLTNAVKYGALSVSAGVLRIEWKRTAKDLKISWLETGMAVVSQPNRKGFGTTLIEHCVKALGGSWQPSFEPEGFRCSLTFPLAEMP